MAVAFTSGHIAFRQSLLVRAADAERFSSYDGPTREVRVGVLRGTTGEARLFQITRLANGDGVLATGTRIDTPGGTLVADGTAASVIAAAKAAPVPEGRIRIHPPDDSMPEVVHLGDMRDEIELLEALGDETIDAVARGSVGNGEAAHPSGGNLVVAALDSLVEYGGFAMDAREAQLVACIDETIAWLTLHRRIGYSEWRTDPTVFLDSGAVVGRPLTGGRMACGLNLLPSFGNSGEIVLIRGKFGTGDQGTPPCSSWSSASNTTV